MSPLQLTFVPPEYWVKSEDYFQFVVEGAKGIQYSGRNPKIPKDVGFFVIWQDGSKKENQSNILETEKKIAISFPKVPAKKLLSCKIKLAFCEGTVVDTNSNKVRVKSIYGKIIPIPPMSQLLFGLKLLRNEDRRKSATVYSDSVKTWAFLTKFSVELLSRGCFVPELAPLPVTYQETHQETQISYYKVYERLMGAWRTTLRSLNDWDRFNSIVQNSPWIAYNLPINLKNEEEINTQEKEKNSDLEIFSDGIWNPSYLFVNYMDVLVDFIVRNSVSKKFRKKMLDIYGYSSSNDYENDKSMGELPWDLRFLESLTSKNKEFQVIRFSETPIPDIIEKWTRNIQGFPFQLGVMFTFKLELPPNKSEQWRLSYHIQPLQEFSNNVHLGDFWNCNVEQRKELENVCEDLDLLEDEIFRALGTASKYFPPIGRSLEGIHPQQIELDTSEVMGFLKHSMYLLIQAGYNVELPEQFKKQGEQRLTAKLKIKSPEKREHEQIKQFETSKEIGTGVKAEPMFGLDSFLEYNWEIKIENDTLSEEEFLRLAESNEPLVFLNGRWVLLNQQDLDALRPIFDKTASSQKLGKPKGKISYLDATKLGILGDVNIGEATYGVELEGDFQDKIEVVAGVEEFKQISTPEPFEGELREYQKTGLKWLANMADLQLGICLADDMGLGKTVEIIAFLLHRKHATNHRGEKVYNDKSTLIVCPTSVLFNWKREIHRFGPDLEVVVHHGSNRPKDTEALLKYTKPNKIILSTYGTVRNDVEFLSAIPFTGVILDESQNIKNYRAQKTQAILELQSRYRIALSGTPIENKLDELWTLFQFLNPGLLGSKDSFRKRFALPIEHFQEKAASKTLHKIVSPFILRRVKTDRSVIRDLPEKNEIKLHIELSAVQQQLYKVVVQRAMQEIEQTRKDKRKWRGAVLRLLTQVKQICNHPIQYLQVNNKSLLKQTYNIHETEEFSIEKVELNKVLKTSLKTKRLSEMIDEILEAGEKILIFTQYKQMGTILKQVLERIYEFSVLFFHGGVSKNNRQQMVDDFQSKELSSPPIMILSLRAGGTGLNLTRASTVFHYDRWWNPAVEDQATDRAYRIGQEKRVNVYKFVSAETIEEKIDKILEEKRQLAGEIIKSKDETFITSLSDKELRDLFSSPL